MNATELERGTLHVVATPLGNLGDLTQRACDVLTKADRVYAEDTRRTRVLLNHIGSSAAIKSLHEHNEKGREAEVLSALEEGLSLALVSDAGTPAICDPGSEIVAAAAQAGFRVTPIPGVSALAAALSVAGFRESSTEVRFVGFLPVKGAARTSKLHDLATQSGLGVFYESPKRLGRTLRELAAIAPSRRALVARELTKLHEELVRGSVAELATWASEGPEIRGEVTVVIGPNEEEKKGQDAGEEELDEAINAVLKAGLSPRDAASAVSALKGIKKRRVYNRLNEILGES